VLLSDIIIFWAGKRLSLIIRLFAFTLKGKSWKDRFHVGFQTID